MEYKLSDRITLIVTQTSTITFREESRSSTGKRTIRYCNCPTAIVAVRYCADPEDRESYHIPYVCFMTGQAGELYLKQVDAIGLLLYEIAEMYSSPDGFVLEVLSDNLRRMVTIEQIYSLYQFVQRYGKEFLEAVKAKYIDLRAMNSEWIDEALDMLFPTSPRSFEGKDEYIPETPLDETQGKDSSSESSDK